MITTYVLTGVSRSAPLMQLRAYSTQSEADEAKEEFKRWRKTVLHVFSNTKLFFAPHDELMAARTKWIVKLPWGARALAAGFGYDDLYAVDVAFDTQAEADLDISVINAMAKSSEAQLLSIIMS